MQEYIIDVAQVEEWQTIRDIDSLERTFQRAKSTIVNGERVLLVRSDREGRKNTFDEFSTLEDLERYTASRCSATSDVLRSCARRTGGIIFSGGPSRYPVG
jgi:hypothetical protein